MVDGEQITFKGLSPPSIAYPTILLAFFAVSLQAASSYLYLNSSINDATIIILNSIAAFIAFTPMHDSAHGSIATVNSGHKYLNDCIGLMCSWTYPLPYYAFKYMVR